MLRPGSVDQILAVVTHIRRNHSHCGSIRKAYWDAVRVVSSQEQLRYQTIGDLCRKRLGLKRVDDFLCLLEKLLQGAPGYLERLLIKKSHPDCHERIRQYCASWKGLGSELAWEDQVQEVVYLYLPTTIVTRLDELAAAERSDRVGWLSKRVGKMITTEFVRFHRGHGEAAQREPPEPDRAGAGKTVDF